MPQRVTIEGVALFDGEATDPALSSLGWHSVVDYGATGDGATDDAAAIQAALDAAYDAGGGVVVFPAGRLYCVSTFIVAKARTTVLAYGATIRSIHASRGVLRNFEPDDSFPGFAGHSGIAILGGVWDGNAYNDGTGLVTGTTNIMCFIHCRDITVRDATFRDCSGAHGLELNSTSGARIESCRFEGFADNTADQSRVTSEAIELDVARAGSSAIGELDGTACEDVSITNCWFGPSDRLGDWGRAVGSHSIVAGSWYERITVRDCEIASAYEAGIRAQYWRDSLVSGCKIKDTGGPGIHALTTIAQGCDGLTVADNHVRGSGADAGIHIEGLSTALLSDVVIRGNRIQSAAGYGIRADYAPGILVEGNRIDDPSGGGILALESDGATVSGNSIASAGSNGINIAGCDRALVSGNSIDGTTANHGITVGSSASPGGDALVQGNHVYGAASAGIRLSSPRCTVTGNQVRRGGATDNGVSVASSATGCVIAGNDLAHNGWSAATALLLSTTAALDWTGGTASPGHNRI